MSPPPSTTLGELYDAEALDRIESGPRGGRGARPQGRNHPVAAGALAVRDFRRARREGRGRGRSLASALGWPAALAGAATADRVSSRDRQH